MGFFNSLGRWPRERSIRGVCTENGCRSKKHRQSVLACTICTRMKHSAVDCMRRAIEHLIDYMRTEI